MTSLNVKFAYNTLRKDFEATSRGYRSDIFLIQNGQWYQINAYTILRLQQDFDAEMEYSGFYTPEPNLIFVEETSIENILFTLKKLQKEGVFKQFVPISDEQVQSYFSS